MSVLSSAKNSQHTSQVICMDECVEENTIPRHHHSTNYRWISLLVTGIIFVFSAGFLATSSLRKVKSSQSSTSASENNTSNVDDGTTTSNDYWYSNDNNFNNHHYRHHHRRRNHSSRMNHTSDFPFGTSALEPTNTASTNNTSDITHQQQPQQQMNPPFRSRRSRSIPMPPVPDASFTYSFVVDVIALNPYRLQINTSDPFFNSSSTCNTINGGQLVPPAICSKENPCEDLSHLYQGSGLRRTEVGQFTDFSCSGWTCTTEPRWEKGYRDVFGEHVPIVKLARRGCTMKQTIQFLYYKNIGEVKSRNNGAGPTEAEMRSVLPLTRFYDDGAPQKIEVPNTFLPETNTRHVCKYVPPMPEKFPSQTGGVTTTTAGINNNHNNNNNNTNTNATENRIPLIILIPGTTQNASGPYTTPIRDMSMRRKFAVISIQAMNRHWHASGWIGPNESATKSDYLFRNITHNDDIKFVDAVIDEAVASGKIDPKRIYIYGSSNGLTFGALYGIMRSGSTDGGALLYRRAANGTREIDPELQRLYTGRTPGGNRVAAVGGTSGLDPFRGVGWARQCHTWPAPRSAVPFYMVSAICDVVRCTWARDWVNRMANEVGSNDVRWRLLDLKSNPIPVASCTDEAVQKTCKQEWYNLWGHAMIPDWVIVQVVDFLLSKKLAD